MAAKDAQHSKMTAKENLLSLADSMVAKGCGRPIFRILLFENSAKEMVDKYGRPMGFPDIGAEADIGFFYDLDAAILAMNDNACDIRETVYDAGFILCLFPGLYQSAGKNERMYFVWDDDKKGFFQKEEPGIFRHISY